MGRTAIFLACILVMVLTGATISLAQQPGPTPTITLGDDAQESELSINLESVTANAANFYNQPVTLEGVVGELVNVRTFVLGEGAAIDNDQVLVINHSGDMFPLWLTAGEPVAVTGTIYPSFEAGGFNELLATTDVDLSPMAEILQERFGMYTLLVVSSIDSVSQVGEIE